MRLVRLKLRSPTAFWILQPINLCEGNEFSPLLNVDMLTRDQRAIIDKSIRAHQIALYDPDGNLIRGTLANVNKIYGNVIPVEDIPEELDVVPEIIAITVEDEEEVEPEAEELPIEDYLDDARRLLNKNGNTVKKVLRSLPPSDESLALLHACLQVELETKNREGILFAIQSAIGEY